MVAPYRYKIENFSKGLVTSVAEDEVSSDALKRAINATVSGEYLAVSNSPYPEEFDPGVVVNGQIIHGTLKAYKKLTDYYTRTEYTICAIDNKIYGKSSQNGSWVELWSFGSYNPERVAVVVYNNEFSIFTQGSRPIAVTVSPSLSAEYLIPNESDSQIKGDIAVLSNDKIFVAGDPSNPSMLYFSATGENRDFKSDYDAGAVAISSNDGDEIVALVPFQYKLFIFKKNSIWVLTGKTPDEFMLEMITDTCGAISKDAVAKTDKYVYFNSGSGLYRIGESFEPIDKQIKNDTKSSSESSLSFSVGEFVFFRCGSRMFLYNEDEEVFTEIDKHDFEAAIRHEGGCILRDSQGGLFAISRDSLSSWYEIETNTIFLSLHDEYTYFVEQSSEKIVRFVRLKVKGKGEVQVFIKTDDGFFTGRTLVNTSDVDYFDVDVFDRTKKISIKIKVVGRLKIYGAEIFFVQVKERV